MQINILHFSYRMLNSHLIFFYNLTRATRFLSNPLIMGKEFFILFFFLIARTNNKIALN
jgi:hypothetical protein